jgi:NADP-dependent 3-hydroxy acid dehydrogenase YdfG
MGRMVPRRFKMKFYVITLPYDNVARRMVYPSNYQIEIGDQAVDHLYYKDGAVTKLLLLIQDKDALVSLPGSVVEITEAEAITVSQANEQETERLTDPAKVQRLDILVRAGGHMLSADELKALDPDDPTPGVGKNLILASRIADHKLEE